MTIPQYFKENGYETFSLGKVFHPGKSSNFTDDYPYSWSHYPYHPPTDKFKDKAVCWDPKTKNYQSNLICPIRVKDQPGKSLPDLQTLDYAVNLLRKRNNTKPYFLAVGFHKPHIPLKFPRKYLGKQQHQMYIPVYIFLRRFIPFFQERFRLARSIRQGSQIYLRIYQKLLGTPGPTSDTETTSLASTFRSHSVPCPTNGRSKLDKVITQQAAILTTQQGH